MFAFYGPVCYIPFTFDPLPILRALNLTNMKCGKCIKSIWLLLNHCPKSESTTKCSLQNVYLVSSFMEFHNLFDKTAAFNSGQTTDHFLMCAALPLAAIGLLSNLPFGSSHLTYAHIPKACSDASLNMMRQILAYFWWLDASSK